MVHFIHTVKSPCEVSLGAVEWNAEVVQNSIVVYVIFPTSLSGIQTICSSHLVTILIPSRLITVNPVILHHHIQRNHDRRKNINEGFAPHIAATVMTSSVGDDQHFSTAQSGVHYG
jgi:hypothetical protein